MGGTFDPIHNGHLRTALEIREWLDVEKVWLMPSKRPVHRDLPGSTSSDRLAMVQCAVANEPGLACDPREVISDQPSYTIFTLEALRQELGTQMPVCMIMGMDAFLSLDQWLRYEEYLAFCHILVVARPGYDFEPNTTLTGLLKKHQVTSPEAIWQRPNGSIIVHQLTPLSISATQIRAIRAQGLSPRYLVPDSVCQYIQEHKLYS